MSAGPAGQALQRHDRLARAWLARARCAAGLPGRAVQAPSIQIPAREPCAIADALARWDEVDELRVGERGDA
jgi:hypothetical protein